MKCCKETQSTEATMNVVRMLNPYCQRPNREKISFIIFLVIIFIIFAWFWNGMPGKRLEFVCSSERNLRHAGIFKKANINVIPSVPQRGIEFPEMPKYVVNGTQVIVDPYESECLNIKSRDGTYMICIHDPYRDLIVSAHLKGEGYWEKDNVAALHEAYRRFPDLTLVDLGCNIGVFTVPAAKMGMEVLAVDPMLDSLRLLQRSLFINGLDCHVTLLHNAVHRKRSKMRLVVDPTNFGGARVAEINKHVKDISGSQLVDAICLDDLVPLVRGQTIFLKIDVEGSEAFGLGCAEEFFSQVNVKILLLEWSYLRKREAESMYVKSFLTAKSMVPVWGLDTDRVIDVHASHSWPDQVYWMKKE